MDKGGAAHWQEGNKGTNGTKGTKVYVCWVLRHISFFLAVFCGWKSDHIMTKTQFCTSSWIDNEGLELVVSIFESS